jgi:hypothetical protein
VDAAEECFDSGEIGSPGTHFASIFDLIATDGETRTRRVFSFRGDTRQQLAVVSDATSLS